MNNPYYLTTRVPEVGDIVRYTNRMSGSIAPAMVIRTVDSTNRDVDIPSLRNKWVVDLLVFGLDSDYRERSIDVGYERGTYHYPEENS